MTRKEKAMHYFKNGYNCAQSVALAFEDLIPFEKKDIAKLASSFGGGMGRLREVCGAVSAMFMIVGLLYGYENPETGDLKKEHYKRIQNLAKEFEEKNGSIICRELLNLNVKREEPTPEARTEKYYKTRPCVEYVGEAAEILERFISEN